MESLVSIAEAAREFKVHRATIYRYIRSGRLTAYHRELGRRTFVDRNELRRLNETRPAPPRADA